MLQNKKAMNSDAIILMAKELTITYNIIMNLSFRDLGLFLAVINQKEDSLLRFVQNFDITLTMDSRLTAPGHQLTNICVDMSPIMIRVAYNDIRLIREVFDGVFGPTENAPTDDGQVKPIPPTIVMSREKVGILFLL
jgi:vacuolar protein sorting-associated protein 13A/C